MSTPYGQAPDGFEHTAVTTNGITLHAVIGGSGAPVLLLHGWPQTWRAWRHVMPILAQHGYRVIAPDLRGLGHSSHAHDGYDKDGQAEDMRALLHRLGVTGEVRLVGHDIGGMVAFAYARRHPQEVARLALVELAVPGFGLERAMNPATGGSFHFGLFMTPDVPEVILEGAEHAFLTWWFNRLAHVTGAFPPEEITAITASYTGREALRASFGHYRTLLEDGRTNRAWAEGGGGLPMPVLTVGGEHNAGARLAEALRPIAPHLTSAVVEDSGHFVPDERPDDLARHLTAFLT
ncbi:alpha/beta hydrolase [Nonomuraea sp. KC401]|uniref:alpha/beta fold hydrolase n=1 Tax=unclassified Nonomuraea TaxID=2593643 RepID=UPI0010FD2643|nr:MULTISPECIES: alpha/beta hydrolase [unclassified Nonomuraea]NBE93253.1 alpha/beta fold hydrolase [Nonomuraea sp. K271]TLF78009.1 alpha/beta hydrolase [Nonomuraea sp. KC401]